MSKSTKINSAIKNILIKPKNEMLKYIRSLHFNKECQYETKPILKSLNKNSYDHNAVIKFYHLLVKYAYKQEAQKLIFIYLEKNYNDQEIVSLLEQPYKAQHETRALVMWEKLGKPVPPPHVVKQNILKGYAQQFNLKILVESGTLFWDMVEALKNNFEKIYFIELSDELCVKARKKFENDSHVKIVHGDSEEKIKNVLDEINEHAIFWLDAHYSGGFTAKGKKETPIFEELDHILASKINHVIIIDDARLFGTDTAYLSINELSEFIKSRERNVQINVDSDAIKIIPLKE